MNKKIDTLFLTIILIALTLYRVKVLGLITIADIALLIFITVSIIKFKRIYFDAFNLTYFLWFIISLTPIFIYSKYSFFSIEHFFNTSSRVFFSIISMFFINLWLKTPEQKNIFITAIKNCTLFILYSQIVIVILFYSGFENLFNVITSNAHLNRGQWLNIYDYKYYFRFGGLFEEPSWFSWFLTYIVGIIVGYEYVYKKEIFDKKFIVLLIISICFTFSIAGLMSIIILISIRYFSHSFSIKGIFYLLVFVTILSILALTNEHFMDRLSSIMSGNDASSNVRLAGSFYRVYVIFDNLLFGTGFGNSINGILYFSQEYNIRITESIATQNGFAEVFVSTGLIAGILYCAPIFFMIFKKKYRIIFITICLVYFTSSAIYVAPAWMLLSISYYLFKE